MAEGVAVITGGARGIGRDIGLTLKAQGRSLAVFYRTRAEAGAETAAAVEERGAEQHTLGSWNRRLTMSGEDSGAIAPTRCRAQPYPPL